MNPVQRISAFWLVGVVLAGGAVLWTRELTLPHIFPTQGANASRSAKLCG